MTQVQFKSRIPELDGIRGLAIFSVICFHYISLEGVMPAGSITDRLHRLVILDGTGVDLFFVLSGFLIGGIRLDVKESPRYFSTFYVRRFFRIIPVYFAWIIAYTLVAASRCGRRVPCRDSSRDAEDVYPSGRGGDDFCRNTHVYDC